LENKNPPADFCLAAGFLFLWRMNYLTDYSRNFALSS
jgi:hypothetical protein